MKKIFTTLTLALVLSLGSTASFAGGGIIISDSSGIIVGDIFGIIVGDKATPCSAKDGIIVSDGIIVGD